MGQETARPASAKGSCRSDKAKVYAGLQFTYRTGTLDMMLRDRMERMINELLDGHILLEEAIGEFEKIYIQNALTRHSDHVSETAAALGIHRNTLAKRIASYKTPPTIKKRNGNSKIKKRSAGR